MSDEIDDQEVDSEKPIEAAQVSTSVEMETIALIGDVTESSANEIIFSLLVHREKKLSDRLISLINQQLSEDSSEEEEEIEDNINFYISTNGGSADEMYGIYDIMRLLQNKDKIVISTIGIGKVMSAGVLLLAAGTKGHRKIGKHCRVMIHSVIGGHMGPMHQLVTEFEQMKKVQDSYIKSLVEVTSMTEEYLTDLLDRKTNIYLTAEEAVNLGIADEIF